MKTAWKVIPIAIGFALLAIGADPTAYAQSRSGNPLLAAPMPLCGPLTPAFAKLLADLKQRPAWRGAHGERPGELELTVGSNGVWFLFFHSVDAGKRKTVCLIARGEDSREIFGRPV